MKTIQNQDPKKGTEEDLKSKETPPSSTPGEKEPSEEDTSQFTEAQKNDYIEKLKDENARRRIENKKVKEQLTQQEQQQQKAQKDLEELSNKVKEYETKESERTMAEKSEIEKLQTRMAEIEKEISERDKKIATLEGDVKVKDLKLEESGRERMIDRLASQLGISFSSDYERRGLMTELLERKEGMFILNDEEVMFKLQSLAKERKKTPPTETPGPGPQSRTTGVPLIDEIKALSTKENLTVEDKKRLDELLVEAEKARMNQG